MGTAQLPPQHGQKLYGPGQETYLAGHSAQLAGHLAQIAGCLMPREHRDIQLLRASVSPFAKSFLFMYYSSPGTPWGWEL